MGAEWEWVARGGPRRACEHQTWQVTKVARPMPMKARQAMKALAEVLLAQLPSSSTTSQLALGMKSMPRMGGEETKTRRASDLRGPKMSQRKPTTARITMLVETAEMFASPIWALVRSSEVGLRILEARGAAANIEKNEEKKANHEVWNARLCGLAQLNSTSCVALCSWSTCARAPPATMRSQSCRAGDARLGSRRPCARVHGDAEAGRQLRAPRRAAQARRTGTVNSRPKMSVVPRELMPFFWSAVCSMSISFSSSSIFDFVSVSVIVSRRIP